MDIGFLLDYMDPVIVGICLCVGFMLKNLVETENVNKYIPLIVGILGVVLSVWINEAFTPVVILNGLFSGWASTGMYEAFRNLINKRKGEE